MVPPFFYYSPSSYYLTPTAPTLDAGSKRMISSDTSVAVAIFESEAESEADEDSRKCLRTTEPIP